MKSLRQPWEILTVMVTASIVTIIATASVDAQSSVKTSRIGYLAIGRPPPDDSGLLGAFREGLSDLGYVEGRNIIIEKRFSSGKTAPLPAMAAELVGLNIEVLVTDSTVATVAAKQATTTIPIVFAVAVDPVTAGIVPRLGRPGANITGFAFILSELVGKRLQLLKETFPKTKRVAVLWNPGNPGHHPALKALETAARTLRLSIKDFAVGQPGEFEHAFAAMESWDADALFGLDDGVLDVHRELIANLAIRGRLPSLFGYRLWVEVGGLMSYGPDLAEQFRRSGKLVDKILKGAKPGDLPVEQPSKFELVINFKTMKALGITIPQVIVTRADEIIK